MRKTLAILLISLIAFSACSNAKGSPTTPQPPAPIIDRIAALETQESNTASQLAKIVGGNGQYKFTATKQGIHVNLTSGTGSVAFEVSLIPANPIPLGKAGDSYENALKAMAATPPLGRSFTPTIIWQPNANQWQLVQMSFSTGAVALKSSASDMDVVYITTVPCTAYVSILSVAQ